VTVGVVLPCLRNNAPWSTTISEGHWRITLMLVLRRDPAPSDSLTHGSEVDNHALA
jgi:hypothetical protein